MSSPPSISEIAAQLGCTERTLRRRLKAEGTSFRSLITDTRMPIARQLLEKAGLPVEVVAWRVGYTEAAAFVRAFKSFYGFTPGSLRHL